jgi:hypothetical protein
MVVYVSTVVRLEDTDIIGVYTSYENAAKAADSRIEDLQQKNEDLGSYPHILEYNLDDMLKDDYV